jgi:hypothetical protein
VYPYLSGWFVKIKDAGMFEPRASSRSQILGTSDALRRAATFSIPNPTHCGAESGSNKQPLTNLYIIPRGSPFRTCLDWYIVSLHVLHFSIIRTQVRPQHVSSFDALFPRVVLDGLAASDFPRTQNRQVSSPPRDSNRRSISHGTRNIRKRIIEPRASRAKTAFADVRKTIRACPRTRGAVVEETEGSIGEGGRASSQSISAPATKASPKRATTETGLNPLVLPAHPFKLEHTRHPIL